MATMSSVNDAHKAWLDELKAAARACAAKWKKDEEPPRHEICAAVLKHLFPQAGIKPHITLEAGLAETKASVREKAKVLVETKSERFRTQLFTCKHSKGTEYEKEAAVAQRLRLYVDRVQRIAITPMCKNFTPYDLKVLNKVVQDACDINSVELLLEADESNQAGAFENLVYILARVMGHYRAEDIRVPELFNGLSICIRLAIDNGIGEARAARQ